MLFFAVLVAVFINRDESHGGENNSVTDLITYFRGIWALFKQRAVFGVCLLAGLRTMAQNGIYVLPFYLKDVMGMEALYGLIWAIMQIGHDFRAGRWGMV